MQSRALRRVLVIGVCGLVAIVCAIANVARISVLPPGLSKRHLDVAAATTRVAVDLPKPLLGNASATGADFGNLQVRSVLMANLMTSDGAMSRIARRAGIPVEKIAANTRVTANVQPAMLEPDSERRAAQLADTKRPYELEVRPDPYKPAMTVYAQAPTVLEAERLADAANPGLGEYLDHLARREGADPAAQVRLMQLGHARGAAVNRGTLVVLAGVTFLFAFAMAGAVALGVGRLLRRRAATLASTTGAPEADDDPDASTSTDDRIGSRRPSVGLPAPVFAAARVFRPDGSGDRRALALSSGGAIAIPVPARRGVDVRRTARSVATQAGDWPRTTRVLPWLVAAFMVVIWLVPFNEIQLTVSLPIDLKFDRLVLPVLAGAWVLVLCAGGADSPRVRFSSIHLAVGAVVAVAFLSLVLSAHGLSRTLEFDTAVKKLTLLGSYVAMFVIVASVVRRTEVDALMTYMLVLASICALGTIVEYRFNFNAFFWASDRILPGTFSVGQVTSGVDEIGRRLVRGPGQVSLETVAMLAMAMPVAVARLIHAAGGRQRLAYALVTALLVAAMVSTFRKTALVAPLSVCLTFAYFRRRELLRLAPLGLVLVVIIQVLSPGALRGVTGQLDGNRLGVTTVSDRTADYDAIRPDMWTHLAFGRGYGSYEHTTYRVLDMELLRQIIEVGVVGLIAYLFMAVAVLIVARRPIRARGPDAPVALAVAAAAVCFVVVSTLFDAMSFPHVAYIFLWMAAMLTVVTAADGKPTEERRWTF